MTNLIKIAGRNLFRYKRRTLLTLSLIVIGVLFVAGFMAVTGSFKTMMIGQITDSFVGHMQIHRKGYLAAIENLPLTMNLKPQTARKVETILKEIPGVEAFSSRIKFGAMFSNFTETTNIRLNGVDPEMEAKTVPLLLPRIMEGEKALKKGEILIPELIARGMKVNVGDMVVVIATNRDGSVNGKQLKVGGIMESATGPGGRDGYVHIDDAVEILRMEEKEISEIAVRLKDFDRLYEVFGILEGKLSGELNKQGKPVYEVHTWEQLSPFYNIARMIDMMTFFIKIMLVAVVLISIMNVMIMAVYERVREIGTIAAIGTLPMRILSMFLIEGLLLGVIGAAIGGLLSIALVYGINAARFTYDFARQTDIVLTASVNPKDLLMIVGIVILVAVVASLQPAFKASRMDPIKALGYV
ncbi:MAG: ABC transporter substrate-binding protein [Deltaproteobacteria bacterium HGW-Deltaproteobacteria-21]|nr:MAG: ABC transporter substrate-binding protein [Deltaproteobacteria bacterium HGW-Deltaproteobacteria-21]